MFVLVTYDVSTVDAAGRKRLHDVAKICIRNGRRVQNSVFECLIDAARYRAFRYELEQIINSETDSLRFYELGNNYQKRIIHVGAKGVGLPDDVIII